MKQVAYAEDNGYSGITLSLSQMLAENNYDSDDGLKFADMIKDKIRENDKVIIKTADNRQMADDYLKSSLNLILSDNNVPLKIADNVGKLITQIINIGPAFIVSVAYIDPPIFVLEQ